MVVIPAMKMIDEGLMTMTMTMSSLLLQKRVLLSGGEVDQ